MPSLATVRSTRLGYRKTYSAFLAGCPIFRCGHGMGAACVQRAEYVKFPRSFLPLSISLGSVSHTCLRGHRRRKTGVFALTTTRPTSMASFFFSFVLVCVELSLSCPNHPPSTSHHTCARKPQHLPPVSKNRFALPSLRDLKTFQAHFAHKETPHYTTPRYTMH